MSTLQIKKLQSGGFVHIDSIDGIFFLGRFSFKQEFNKAFLVEAYGAKRREYTIDKIQVYDFGGSVETFTNFTDLENRLVELNYTGIDTNGMIPNFTPSDYDLSQFTNTETDRFAKLSDISGSASDQYYVVHLGIAKSTSYFGANVWQTPDRNTATIFNDTSPFGDYYNGTIITDSRLAKIKLPFNCQLVDGSFQFTHAGTFGTYGVENFRVLAFDISGGAVVGTTTVASASYTQGTSGSNGDLGSFSTSTLLRGTFITYAVQSVVANTYIVQGIVTLVFKKI